MARKPPNLRQKLASALLMMVQPDDTGKMVPVIPFARAMKMTADQIIAEFDFDHAVYVAIGGGNEPWNLTPRLRAAHREKTKRDLANIAKVKRGIAKRTGKAKPKKKIPSRPFPTKQQRQAAKARFAQREARL